MSAITSKLVQSNIHIRGQRCFYGEGAPKLSMTVPWERGDVRGWVVINDHSFQDTFRVKGMCCIVCMVIINHLLSRGGGIVTQNTEVWKVT